MTGTKVYAMPHEHPGAVREGSTVRFGPVHCATHHGGCNWCYENGYVPVRPTTCECGQVRHVRA